MARRSARPWQEIRRGQDNPARAARVAEHRRAMEDVVALNELREARGATQVEVAQQLGIHQANVSRLERRQDVYLSTLREYVEALGGNLDLVARFPDGQEVRLEPAERATRREAAAVR
jgi:transcriptional regulator with XRE-family HTH domain